MYTQVDKFPRGYKDENGEYQVEFEFREMIGSDEEAIAKPQIKNNGAKMVRTILERCIVRIGDIEAKSVKPTQWTEIIQNLAIGDQDYALMQIRALTLGDELEVRNYVCPHCKEKLDAVFSLDEIPMIPYNGSEVIEFELPKGYTDKEGNVHKIGTLRYPIGLDRELIDTTAKKNISVANSMLMARCITSLGELKNLNDIVKKLSIKDRNYLLKMIQDNNFGYDVNDFDLECSSCGETLTVSLNSASFL